MINEKYCNVHSDRIFCVIDSDISPGHAEAGVDGPGWYFWDEADAFCHGPFNSIEETESAMNAYADVLDNGPNSKSATPPLLLIEWRDTRNAEPGWTVKEEEDHIPTLSTCFSVGYLYLETSEAIILAQSYSPEDEDGDAAWSERIVIARSGIVSIANLEPLGKSYEFNC